MCGCVGARAGVQKSESACARHFLYLSVTKGTLRSVSDIFLGVGGLGGGRGGVKKGIFLYTRLMAAGWERFHVALAFNKITGFYSFALVWLCSSEERLASNL